MARNIQHELEREADKKGLQGEERQRYIGGAWNHIKNDKQHRAFWRESDDYRALSAVLGPVESLRTPKSRPDRVVFRQGATGWYELPIDEYHRLVDEGRRVEHEKARDRKKHEREERRAIALYERELAAEKREEERAKKREEREKQKAARELELDRAHQERTARAMERAEYEEVSHIIKRAGGIKRGKTAQGREEERGEYNRSIPTHLRATKADIRSHGGISADDAATAINEHMPWLNLQTSDDLYNYFERHKERSQRRAFFPVHLSGKGGGEDVYVPVPVEIPANEATAMPAAHEEHHEHEHEHEEEEQPADWLGVFGEAQPIEKQPEANEAFDIFGGISSTKEKRSNHKHVYEPWRSDWRYMRCVKCGEMKASTFTAKVDR